MSSSRLGFYRSSSRRRRREPQRLGLWLVLAGLVVVGYVLLGGQTGLLTVRGEARAVAELERQLEDLAAGTASLREATDELGEDSSFMLEKVAREQYLMTRPGEQVLHVLEQPQEQAEDGGTELPGPRP